MFFLTSISEAIAENFSNNIQNNQCINCRAYGSKLDTGTYTGEGDLGGYEKASNVFFILIYSTSILTWDINRQAMSFFVKFI